MTDQQKQNPFMDLIVSIVLPSVVLMKFSGEDNLGPVMGLIVALAFPLGWGLYELIVHKKRNFVALLGLISVLLTGGIGLMKLDNQWLAIKEAAIPALIGIGVVISTYTKYPLVKTLLFNPKILHVDKINEKLEEKNNKEQFDKQLLNTNYLLAGTFLFSSIMNYILAKWIVVSPSGTEAFNEELGKMTLMSYPMIAIPSMIMMLGVFYYLWKTINKLSGLTLEEVIAAK
ncbi:VC0807 family protein [Leucothrix arctica]|uniref:MFS transporter n=1 Tax=Leucothrix arctica TaxID=1481894 RepID=A0A317C878_9GAMM|nr:VC0807 family protein [Leucothrix arctica]PWQ94784.1 MFS transporter [Leucothrix arctica]